MLKIRMSKSLLLSLKLFSNNLRRYQWDYFFFFWSERNPRDKKMVLFFIEKTNLQTLCSKDTKIFSFKTKERRTFHKIENIHDLHQIIYLTFKIKRFVLVENYYNISVSVFFQNLLKMKNFFFYVREITYENVGHLHFGKSSGAYV